jgi:hypothetical protein
MGEDDVIQFDLLKRDLEIDVYVPDSSTISFSFEDDKNYVFFAATRETAEEFRKLLNKVLDNS